MSEAPASGDGGYVGRFAPTPSGPLHFGSLLAALASCLEARRRNGRWLVRIEDIDPPREKPGAAVAIVAALERYGFRHDGEVIFQRRQSAAHRAAADRLLAARMAYRCGCSRSDLAEEPAGELGTIYPGTCRQGTDATETAIRVLTDDRPIEFTDGLQGRQAQRLESESGDFVIVRRDGLVAYQLAVVVDDFEQGITDVVRGIDLMPSTPRQIWLQRQLGYPTPRYMHIPIATSMSGDKLSKASGAAALPSDRVSATLVQALAALGQSPPGILASASVGDVWQWAMAHWDASVLAGRQTIPTGIVALDRA